MSEELDSHPTPQVEEDIDWQCNGQQQAIEADAATITAARRKVLVYSCRIQETTEGQERDQAHHQGQRWHGLWLWWRQTRNLAPLLLWDISLLVLLDQPGVLGNHVWDSINDRIGDAKLVVYQLTGLRVVSVKIDPREDFIRGFL